jgi:hypothetical protein
MSLTIDGSGQPSKPLAIAAVASCSSSPLSVDAHPTSIFCISVVAMTGAAISIDDASAADTILSVKERVFAVNRKLHVRRQRLVYRRGPHGIDPLSDDETLGGAGVARDGTAELDVLLVEFTAAEADELGSRLLTASSGGCLDEMAELLDEGANVDFA